MRIIPAIDIIDGKCVRLSKGDYDTKKLPLKTEPIKSQAEVLPSNNQKFSRIGLTSTAQKKSF